MFLWYSVWLILIYGNAEDGKSHIMEVIIVVTLKTRPSLRVTIYKLTAGIMYIQRILKGV